MNQSIQLKFKKSPSFSFRQKYNNGSYLYNPQKIPGPTHYNPQKSIKNSKNVKFGQSTRKTIFESKQNSNFTPGPGQYQTLTNQRMNSSFSSKSSLDNKKFHTLTLTSRFKQKQQNKPGPGAYNIKNDFKNSLPKFSIGRKLKNHQQIQLQKNKSIPPPGAYQHEKSFLRQQSSTIFSIPKSPRMKQTKSPTPGPGNYQTQQKSFVSQRSFGKKTFGNMKRETDLNKNKIQSPGPGRYSSQTKFQQNIRKHKGFSCRKLIQITQSNGMNPGPGYYNSQKQLKLKSTINIKIPQAQRKTTFDINGDNDKRISTPGPGKYQNLNESYNKLKFKSLSAPKFSKAKLQTLTPLKSNIVQRFYDSKIQLTKKKSQSFLMGSSKKVSIFDKVTNKLPGPGDYNPEDKLIRQKKIVPLFSTSKRPNVILNSFNTGPGSYRPQIEQNSKIGIKFSRSKRNTDFNQLKQNSSLLKMSQYSAIKN